MKMSKRIFNPAITLFVMSVMLFSVSLWPSVQGATRPSPKSNAAALQSRIRIPHIPITITFGRASKKCGGFGICKITVGIVAEGERTVRAELSTVSGKLQLTLLEKAPEEGRTLFIDEDIPLSADTAKQLGFRNATIQRGAYAFSANKSLLTARLTK